MTAAQADGWGSYFFHLKIREEAAYLLAIDASFLVSTFARVR